jgi:hypothetical protein
VARSGVSGKDLFPLVDAGTSRLVGSLGVEDSTFAMAAYRLARARGADLDLLDRADPHHALPGGAGGIRLAGTRPTGTYATQTERAELPAAVWDAAGIGDTALVRYRQVASNWAHADPAFGPRVERARLRIAALSGQ